MTSQSSPRQPEPTARRRYSLAPGIRGLLITATDTGIGKTVVSSVIAATLRDRGERVAVFKPVVTGLDEHGDEPPDHELLRASAHSDQSDDEVAPYRFGPPLSPHLAARLAGVQVEPAHLIECAARAAAGADALIVEGVGGLAVPLTDGYLVRDFAADLSFPIVVVARPGLGTINHTLLTLDAARAAGLDVAGVVLTNWPDEPGEMELSNFATIQVLGGCPVSTLGSLYTGPPINPAGNLPVDAWLARATVGAERLSAARTTQPA